MKKFVALCTCAFVLFACSAEESSKESGSPAKDVAQAGAQKAQAGGTSAMTDEQVFAYVLGQEYGLPTYVNAPARIGEMLDLDAMIQGIVDNERGLKDSSWRLQLSPEAQKEVNEHYEKVGKDRELAGENAKPVVIAGPITGKNVVLSDTTPAIIKYSYAQGLELDMLFDAVRRNFGEDFDARFFIRGVRESVYGFMDPSFKKAVPEERLNAVNAMYLQRMDKIREERRRQ